MAGTGSIAVGADATGRILLAGGWGWVLGDKGAAAEAGPGLAEGWCRWRPAT